MRSRKEQFAFLRNRQPWDSNANPIWIASTIGLSRNLEKQRFPGRMKQEEREKLLQLLSNLLLGSTTLDHPRFFPAQELGPLEKEFLYEHYFAKEGFQQAMGGEGFITDATGRFLATINLGDHLHLQVTDCLEDLEEGWNRLVRIEAELGQNIQYAFSPRFGYLTAQPTQCGTGLNLSTYLHLPALRHTGSLTAAIQKRQAESIAIDSLMGDLDQLVGDLVVVHNARTLGVTDEAILQGVRAAALKLVVAEKSARSALRSAPAVRLKDQVSRAFGLLTFSYQIETREAWDGLSLLKLGADLGWVRGVDQRQLNELLFTMPRAHLVCEYSEEISHGELPHKRAEYLHAHLRGVELTI